MKQLMMKMIILSRVINQINEKQITSVTVSVLVSSYSSLYDTVHRTYLYDTVHRYTYLYDIGYCSSKMCLQS